MSLGDAMDSSTGRTPVPTFTSRNDDFEHFAYKFAAYACGKGLPNNFLTQERSETALWVKSNHWQLLYNLLVPCLGGAADLVVMPFAAAHDGLAAAWTVR
jgi:hypothetical protein